ncbi:hypothetical protein [Pseudomonas sp. MUP55]|uniref:hypothetical protein n=1 Tax=Pseudomonas sp. MUP55 TaxID=3087234 RepID=UPI002A5AEFB9|nr:MULTISPECIES: hypothetical protein [unclassified Pseudomonas]WPN93778.1 hypothetical protein SC319_05270 [Pseudomonas sp. MUP56]WPN99304.1 hypothetical protein SC318_05270 [Pseudomonas sp. MUP55]
MSAREICVKLVGFTIRTPDGSNSTNELYANGVHQCHVIIDIAKQTSSDEGVWTNLVLTEEERASVTVFEWSTQVRPALPQGWSCDEHKNIYSLGLWQRKPSESTGDGYSEFVMSAQSESVSRYLRCDPDAPAGPKILMAQVVIDGHVYTTNGYPGSASFKSHIIVDPVRPLNLGVRDLDAYVDEAAFKLVASPDYFTDVDVYYWVPPSGLHFIANKGLDDPVDLVEGGRDFQCFATYGIIAGTSLSGMVGTLINKDSVDMPVDVREVYQTLSLPAQYPPVVFNKYPTIMRALRLYAFQNVPVLESRGDWHLVDNFGNEHKFLLEAEKGLGGVILRDAVAPPRFRVIHFEIILPGGQSSTNALYANGRHQCKVLIEVVVEQETSEGGWEVARLTAEERESLVVTLYSSNINQPLPDGWHCDKQKNQYDAGLRGQVADERVMRLGVDGAGENTVLHKEVIERYMRFDSGRAVEPNRFMAKNVIAGVTYTTNSSVGDIPFDTSVYIAPVRPYVLKVADLNLYVDTAAYDDDYAAVDVYYWSPKDNLRFLVSLGFDELLPVPGEGEIFQTSFSRDRSSYVRRGVKFGIVTNRNTPGVNIPVVGIYRWHPAGGNNIVRFDQVSTIMRAVWMSTTVSLQYDGDSRSKWRLWDNYGCEQVFWLQSRENEYSLELRDG